MGCSASVLLQPKHDDVTSHPIPLQELEPLRSSSNNVVEYQSHLQSQESDGACKSPRNAENPSHLQELEALRSPRHELTRVEYWWTDATQPHHLAHIRQATLKNCDLI